MPAYVLGKFELNTDPKALLSSDISSYVPMAAIVGEGSPQPIPGLSVHSDDVAMIHVESLKPPIPGNQDFVLSSGGINGIRWDDAKDIVRRHFPDAVEKGLLPLKGSVPNPPIKVDANKVERVFNFKYKSYEEQIVATVQHYLDAVAKSG